MPTQIPSTHADIPAVAAAIYAVVVVLLLVVILVPVILIVANRAEPDQRGLRPFTVYLFAMSFLAVLIGYAGSIVIVTGFVRLFDPHYLPIANSVARQCVVGLIVVLVAVFTLVFHLRRGVEIARTDDRVDSPNARILHTYVSGVSFVVTAIVLAASAVAIYLVCQLIAPGVFGASSRGSTGRALLDLFYVIVAGVVIVLAHLRYGPPRLLPRPLQPRSQGPPPSPAPPMVVASAGVVPGPLQSSPPPPAPAPAPPAAPPSAPAPPHEQTPLPPFGGPTGAGQTPTAYQPAPPPPAPPYPAAQQEAPQTDEPPGSLPPFNG
jgi:hypothetical protein